MRKNKNSQGFTLIEILIVLVIIGITFGFALLAFGDFGESRRILFSAEQLANTLRLAQQQAILETSTLGLRIDNTSYQFLKLQNNSQWNPISNTGVFKLIHFPQDAHIVLKTNSPIPIGAPNIIITSSGDMTPFTLNFGSTKEDTIASIRGTHNGEIHFKPANTK